MKMTLVLEGQYNCVTRIDTDAGNNQLAIAQILLCTEPQCYVHLDDKLQRKHGK
jgi:hypothetical protein